MDYFELEVAVEEWAHEKGIMSKALLSQINLVYLHFKSLTHGL